jgi:hypothetical protein
MEWHIMGQSANSLVTTYLFLYRVNGYLHCCGKRDFLRKELVEIYNKLETNGKNRLEKISFWFFLSWLVAIILIGVAYSLTFFGYFADQFQKLFSFSPGYKILGYYKAFDSILFLNGWMSCNLLFVAYVYLTYDKYDSQILEEKHNMEAQPAQNPSKPNIFQLIQLLVTENNNDCASVNIAQFPLQENQNTPNRSRLQKMEEMKKCLGEMKKHKKKLFGEISIFIFWWFMQAFEVLYSD